MKKTKWIQKILVGVFCVVMVVAVMLPIYGVIEVQAKETRNQDENYFIDTGLMDDKETLFYSFDLNGGTVAKIKLGTDQRTWFIAGIDGKNTLALLSASSLGTSEFDDNLSTYGDDTKVKLNSKVRNYLKDTCETDLYFSNGELMKMKETTVTTKDYTGINHSVTGKLYLPNIEVDGDGNSTGNLMVGESDSITVPFTSLTTANGLASDIVSFCLRATYKDSDNNVFAVYPGVSINNEPIYNSFSVVPAFNLDLTSVLLASTAPTDTEGEILNSAMTPNTFILRYKSNGNETIELDVDKTVVMLKNAKGKYLMIQNDDGVYAKLITTDDNTVLGASTVSSKLKDFKNCKVWLESTDEDRITTAKQAGYGAYQTYTITYSANDGSGAVKEIITAEGNASTLPGNEFPAPSGKKFKSWAIGSTSGKQLDPGSSYTFTEPTTVYAIWEDLAQGHIHSYENFWSKDADFHWRACSCGAKIEEAVHTYREWITDKEATVSEEGTKHRVCSECKYIESGTIEKLPSNQIIYQITIREGDAHQLKSENHLVITSQGSLDNLTGIYVDGNQIGSSDYELDLETTTLILKSSYLNTLGVGTHTLKLQYSDGYATTTFVVNATEDEEKPTDEPNDNTINNKDDVPQTGDNSSIVLLIVFAVISGAGVLYCGKKKKEMK